MVEITARVKLSMEIPAEMAQEIMELKRPLQLPMTVAIRHLLTIGLQTVRSEHNGSLGTALEAMGQSGGE